MEERSREREMDMMPDYGTSSRRRSRRYSTAGSSPVVIRTDSASGYPTTPYSNPIGIPGRAGSSGSAGYAPGGSSFAPTAATAAMPIPGAGMGAGGSPYMGAGGSPYGASAMPGTGTSPYGGGMASSMPGAGMAVPGGLGAGGGFVGAVPSGAVYPNTTPPMGVSMGGVGATAQPAGMPYTTGGQGVTFPGGYQAGMAGNQAAAYAGNPPSPYNPAGNMGLPNVATQPVGYAASQPGYAGVGAGVPYGQQQTGLPYAQTQPTYADAGMNGLGGAGGATIVANGRTIPAPSGSTIFIDTKSGRKSRSRRMSTSGYESSGKHHRHRSSSRDPLRREQGMMGYPMAAR